MKNQHVVVCLCLCLCLVSTIGQAASPGKGKPRDFLWLGEDRKAVCEQAPPRAAIPGRVLSRRMERTAASQAAKETGDAEYWNRLALDLIVKYQRNPLRAARILTLLNTTLRDTRACLGDARAPEQAAAAGEAAARLLEFLFPQEPEGRFDALSLARLGDMPEARASRAIDVGDRVAFSAIARAINDGADAVWDVRARPEMAPAIWRAAPPTYGGNPVEPMAGQWRTWVLKDGGEVQPPPPPAYASARFREEMEEVHQVSKRLNDAQKAIADRWHLGNGTVTPVGVWNRTALALIGRHGLSEGEAQGLLAALNVAMMDASIACWRTKFTHWTVRPVNVIQERIDRDFMPYLVTPGFPAYVSGHSAVSGAAATVLKAYFPRQAAELEAMAEEAAMSRLYGGIHFRSDNDEGLKQGREVGRRVLAKAFGRPGGTGTAPRKAPAR